MINICNNEYVSRTLYHFIGRGAVVEDEQYKILLKILTSKQLLFDPDGTLPKAVKTFDEGSFKFQGEISKIPAVCFCDIPLSSISIHIEKYSKFGIGFRKQVLCDKGVRPVWYIPKNSYSTIATSEKIEKRFPEELLKILNAISLIIRKLVDRDADISQSPNKLTDDNELQQSLQSLHPGYFFILAEIFWYFKFYDSSLPDEHLENYYFEREWRKVNGNLPFTLDDIDYIILPSKKYKDDLVKEIPCLNDKIKLVEEI